jgi:hypothetical protein
MIILILCILCLLFFHLHALPVRTYSPTSAVLVQWSTLQLLKGLLLSGNVPGLILQRLLGIVESYIRLEQFNAAAGADILCGDCSTQC